MADSEKNWREEILLAIPELELVKNETYRQAILDIWTEAYESTSWDSLEQVPKSGVVKEFNNVNHTRSVTQQAIAVADVLEQIHGIHVERDILITGALLHDIGKCVEYDREGNKTDHGRWMQHGVYPVHQALRHRLPLEVQHMIISHTGWSKVPPQTIESIILYYVDLLDSDSLLHVLGRPLFLKK